MIVPVKEKRPTTGSRFAAIPGLQLVASYQRGWLRADVLGGLTLWAMLVPQSLGFAVLAGMPAVVGLYAAIAAMLLYWLWGSSRFLNVGAESTVAIMLATILSGMADPGSDEYLELATTMALLVGLVLTLGGIFRLGRIADLLSRPVLAGYVFGSGVLIVTSQLQGFLGTSIDPDPYLTEIGAVVRNIDDTQVTSVVFGVATLIVMLGMRRFVPAVPGALVAVAGSMLVVGVFDIDVAVVGQFDGGLPIPGMPTIEWSQFVALLGPAVAVALLVYPDSVLTARSLTYGTSDRVDANREFFGVGAANIGAGLLGAFPVNGSQSRSFVLADSGARTQVANLAAAVFVILTLVLLAPVFDYLPVATLAAIVIVAGFGLFDPAEFRALWKYRRSEFWMAVLTVAAVLGLGMLIGIVVAILLSLLAMALRSAAPHTAVLGQMPDTDTYRDIADHPDAVTFPGLLIYRFDAPLFFANAPMFRDDVIAKVQEHQATTVVLDMESIHDIDSTGAQALGEVLDELDRRGITLELARVKTEVRDELHISGVEARLARSGIYLEIDDAVARFLEHEPDDSA
ncbi:SulP family inorganic anion transporter [Ilumatobacter sp.]|uniref:SulP family inorganic anion transporter n=1 Tax=Ilumatobacter sp. TaxID=1967498 RepID=UPI003C322C9F